MGELEAGRKHRQVESRKWMEGPREMEHEPPGGHSRMGRHRWTQRHKEVRGRSQTGVHRRSQCHREGRICR